MTQQATSTTTVRLVEAFRDNKRAEDHPEVFETGTSNRVYRTLDGHQYVVTSWTDQDGHYGPNVVPWHATNEHGDADIADVLQHLMDPVNAPHFDGPDTDETHEAALALIGYSVAQSEEDAA